MALDFNIHMVILPEAPLPGFHVLFYSPEGAERSPVRKEYEKVCQPAERRKIDSVLADLAVLGLRAPGLRFEKVKGARAELYELKIKSFGSEHRFLAGLTGWRDLDGRRVLVLLKYLRKKQWKLDRGDIETAAARLLRLQRGES